jgi:uncharacterized protein YegJ (DUF2314 family)
VLRLIIIAIALAFGAYRGMHPATKARTVTGANGQVTVQADGTDPRLKAAAQEAARRWPEFAAAFATRGPDDVFLVKHRFKAGRTGGEHMWLRVTSVTAATVAGELVDEPVNNIGLKMGDSATIPIAEVEDWGFKVGDGPAVGDFSGPVLDAMQKESK